ncbi:hypothetical protein D8Y24_10835 [Agrococcus lahaulensis]|nr:hypothetical protein D8Y24_10835 [Agrococcus lahaulensis]
MHSRRFARGFIPGEDVAVATIVRDTNATGTGEVRIPANATRTARRTLSPSSSAHAPGSRPPPSGECQARSEPGPTRVAAWCAALIANGGPGLLHLVVLVCI